MIRLLTGLVGLSFVVVLVVLNAANLTTFNFFGVVYADVPVIVVALLSFLLGILYAVVYFLAEKVRSRFRGRGRGRPAPTVSAAPDVPPGPAEPPKGE